MSTTRTMETMKTAMTSRRKKCNQMRMPSPQFRKKSLMPMSSIVTTMLWNKINEMVIITSAIQQMIPPPSQTTIIFPPSLQASSIMRGNIRSKTESKTIWTVTTTTAARMVACTRMGNPTFPPPDTQFAKPTDADVYITG